jgi:hypothetical protein
MLAAFSPFHGLLLLFAPALFGQLFILIFSRMLHSCSEPEQINFHLPVLKLAAASATLEGS